MSRRLRASRGHSDALIVILGALAIVIGSSAVGVAVNHLSPRGIPVFSAPSAGQERAPAPGTPVRQDLAPAPTIPTPLPKGLEPITTAEAKSALDKHIALFIDARPADQYAQGHLPGALSLPADKFDDTFPGLADRIEASPFLVIYCDGAECSDSIHVAERLLAYGFLGARVMVDGYRAWTAAGYPIAKGSKP